MQRISGTRRSCSICGYTDGVNDLLFRSFQQSSFPVYHSFIVSEYNRKGFATLSSMPLFSCDLTICCSLGYKHPISTYRDMFYESSDWEEPSPYLLLRAQFAFHQLTHPPLFIIDLTLRPVLLSPLVPKSDSRDSQATCVSHGAMSVKFDGPWETARTYSREGVHAPGY